MSNIVSAQEVVENRTTSTMINDVHKKIIRRLREQNRCLEGEVEHLNRLLDKIERRCEKKRRTIKFYQGQLELLADLGPGNESSDDDDLRRQDVSDTEE